MKTRLATLALVVALAAPATSQQASLTERLDSIAGAPVARKKAIGTVAAVVRGNDTLLFKAYGKADLEWDVPMPTDALFEIGSITKQFTALAILMLRDEGKLSLDDPLTKWFPDFDTRGNAVTLRHLLDHTSGIRNLTETPEFPALVSNRVWPRDSAYALIKRYPFDFPTGTSQLYSNSGFWLLGVVIEKASGTSYGQYLEQKVFRPLGMHRTMVCNSLAHVERRAHGYGVMGAMIMRAPTNYHIWGGGAGALCSTAGDLVAYLRGLHGGKLLTARSYAEMTSRSRLNEWATLRYGMGLGVGPDARGIHHLEHGGILAGFRTQLTWYPESQLGIVVLVNNTGDLDPQDVSGALAAAILPAPAARTFTADATPYVGSYKGTLNGRTYTIDVTKGPGGPLVAANGLSPREVTWLGGDTFLLGGVHLTFARAGTAPATAIGFSPAKGAFAIFPRQ